MERINEIIKDYENGLAIFHIKNKYGITNETLRKIIREHANKDTAKKRQDVHDKVKDYNELIKFNKLSNNKEHTKSDMSLKEAIKNVERGEER